MRVGVAIVAVLLVGACGRINYESQFAADASRDASMDAAVRDGGRVTDAEIDGRGNSDSGTDAAVPRLALDWLSVFTGADSDELTALAVSAGGKIYLGGLYQSSLDLGTGPLPPGGLADIWFSAYENDGTPIFARAHSAGLRGGAQAISLYPDGALVVGGTIGDGGDLGLGAVSTANGGQDLFLLNANPGTGASLAAAVMGTTALDSMNDLFIDDAGNLYVAGSFNGPGSFGGAMLPHLGARDGLVASYDPMGGHRWSFGIGGTGDDTTTSVFAVGARLYVGGIYGTGDVALGGDTLIAGSESRAYLACLDSSDGTVLWTRQLGQTVGVSSNRAWIEVAVDGSGIYVGGLIASDGVDFGDGLRPAAGGIAFAARYTLDNALSWVYTFAAPGFSRGVVDIALGSQVAFGALLDEPTLAPEGEMLPAGAFVRSYTRDGEPVERLVFPGQYVESLELAWDGTGGLIAAGEFTGDVLIGETLVPNTTDSSDIFVARFNP